ncbi:hypothetical protein [Enterococcus hirae]|uniref:hypothetical protein n=1 Tax=Enterococcus hirae TaxID=1354 RepID=UPI001376ECB3|nr:hypothetical protein [Enterococcus hirae]NBA55455.1 hypothetical protein [Enterococcus hirae]
MRAELIDILMDKKVITNEDLEAVKFQDFHGFKSLEKQTDNSIINILAADYNSFEEESGESIERKINELSSLRSELEKGEKIYLIYIFFKNWEDERHTLRVLLEQAKNAKERKVINDVYGFMTPIYLDNNHELSLKVDQDGINYLEIYTENESANTQVCAKIFNLSMTQLKNLYNVAGNHLFRQNVRIGILNKKIGQNLKEEFKNYLKVGLINQIESQDKKDIVKEYFNLSDRIFLKFMPDIFWYKHNGINIFMNDDAPFDTTTDHIIIDSDKVSVINGAQTLTNFFLAEEQLLEEIKSSDLKDVIDLSSKKLDKIMEEILDSIIVKTVFIKGTESLSKTITWGLNNQIPISNQDFVGVSKEVEELNKLLKKYQLKILKTGEIEKIYTGLTPLEFIKLYYIVTDKPGKSKNFNKLKLEDRMETALKEIKEDGRLLKRIDVALEVGKWWDDIYRKSDDKSLFLRYGKNYFQSYIINVLRINDRLDSLVENDLYMYYEELEILLKDLKADVNDYKSDNVFEKILKNLNGDISEDSKKITPSQSRNHYETDLTNFVIENKESNYSIAAIIKRYNSENDIEIEYFRTISYLDHKIKENFPLPNSTFEEFYKREGYMQDNDYPKFNESLFFKELERRYPIYIIFLNQNKEVEKVKLIDDFSISMSTDWKEKAEMAFEKVREAFEKGDSSLFPKLSSNIGFHVRPKAANGNDTFQFSDGEDITRRTFWANSSYIKAILVDNGLLIVNKE